MVYGDNPLNDMGEKCQEDNKCYFEKSSQLWVYCDVHLKILNRSMGIKNTKKLRDLKTRYDGKTFQKEVRYFSGELGGKAKLIKIDIVDY